MGGLKSIESRNFRKRASVGKEGSIEPSIPGEAEPASLIPDPLKTVLALPPCPTTIYMGGYGARSFFPFSTAHSSIQQFEKVARARLLRNGEGLDLM